MRAPSSATRAATIAGGNSTWTPGAHDTGNSSGMPPTLASASPRDSGGLPRAWSLDPRRAEVALGGGVAAAGVLVLLNLVDGVFTHVFLQAGVATELNPLMRLAYEAAPPSSSSAR